MDDWDPTVVNGFAKDRSVILFDNAGIGLSTGATPPSVKGMAECAANFIAALGLLRVDVLGFSLGGYVAQRLTLEWPISSAASLSSVPARAAAKASISAAPK